MPISIHSHFTNVERSLVWFRRDLRDYDNAALFYALKHAKQTYCVFIFDREILDQLRNKADRRVEFIWDSVVELKQALQARGGDLIVRYARADEAIVQLARELKINAVFTNEDYEPMARARDERVTQSLQGFDCELRLCKDTVIFQKSEVLTQASKPFTVFTPYKNAWLKSLTEYHTRAYPTERYQAHFAKPAASVAKQLPSLAEMGFQPTNIKALGIQGGMTGAAKLIADFDDRIGDYKAARDFPAVKGVSYLSVHNRFGTCSIRELARLAVQKKAANASEAEGIQGWLNELIWRDFYFQIIFHRPAAATASFKPEYDQLRWENDKSLFAAWCEARTGYPIIDAAMRQLNQTGFMHNRLRMIVASFLTKDLLIDWRWGEQYFAEHLNDFDLSANNGGWQWAASTGCDAQPYFRIFNPQSQSERFDPQGKFIRRYVPELAALNDKAIHAPQLLKPIEAGGLGFELGKHYPAPIVDHAVQRDKALAMYKAAR
jgi:deoxyribodipyrimidine photo-lyase